MTSNSLTENEEQDIPLHILKNIFGLHALVIFRPKYVWFPVHLKDHMIPDPSGQFAELIVYITSTRVDLYSHQILFTSIQKFSETLTTRLNELIGLRGMRWQSSISNRKWHSRRSFNFAGNHWILSLSDTLIRHMFMIGMLRPHNPNNPIRQQLHNEE